MTWSQVLSLIGALGACTVFIVTMLSERVGRIDQRQTHAAQIAFELKDEINAIKKDIVLVKCRTDKDLCGEGN